MQSQDDQPPGANDATLVAPRAQQGSARLILKRADGQLKEYSFDKDEISIGRLPSNDVVLPEDRSVSRNHAIIRRSNAGYVIEDQQSNNGTYVDGEKILYPYVLHTGQSIKIGSNEMTFSLVAAPVKPAAQERQAPAAQEPPRASEPFFNQPIPQPSFDAPPQPAFNAPPQSAAFPQPPAPPTLDEPPAPFGQAAPAFQQPPGPAYQPAPSFGPPPGQDQPSFGQQGAAFPAPPQPGTAPYSPAPGFQASPAPASPAGAGMITCPNCNQPTMANKAFCLNCGASLGAPGVPAAPPPGAASPFGGAPSFGGPPAAPMAGPGSQPWPQPPAQPQPWPGQLPQAQQPLPGAQPQPWQPQPPAQPQAWPGQPPQPNQFGPGPQAPGLAAGPLDGTVFFPKGLRPIQPSDIRVRLTRQPAAPGGLPPGTPITIRIWSPAQDAFYFAGQGIALRVPAPGAAEEGALQITPLRPTPPGAIDQLLFMVVDANGQQVHPSPVVAEVVISYQPAPPFDGPGSVRLPL